MNDSIQVLSNQIQIKEWAGQRVVTFEDIDTVHQRARGTASRNFRENRDKFIEGTDYFIINQPDEFRRLGIVRPQGGTADKVTLVTESGYLMVVKSLHDDLAWQVQRLLVNCYFRVKEEMQGQEQPQEQEEIKVSFADHNTLLKAAEIAATLPNAERYVVNILRHVVPDIDAMPTVTVTMEGKAVEVPAIPERETAITASTITPPFNHRALDRLMARRRLHDTEIARKIGVSPNAIHNWRKGKNPPLNSNRLALCKALGVSQNYFDVREG